MNLSSETSESIKKEFNSLSDQMSKTSSLSSSNLEDEDASAAVGVKVTKEKLKITIISAVMTAFAGALYCQYQMFISHRIQ